MKKIKVLCLFFDETKIPVKPRFGRLTLLRGCVNKHLQFEPPFYHRHIHGELLRKAKHGDEIYLAFGEREVKNRNEVLRALDTLDITEKPLVYRINKPEPLKEFLGTEP